MSVSVFPAPSGGGGGSAAAPEFVSLQAGLPSQIFSASTSTFYRVTAWASDNTTPVAKVTALASNGDTITYEFLQDQDDTNTINFVEVIISAPSAAKFVVVSDKDGYASVEALTVGATAPIVVTSYTTSQTVTLTQDSRVALLGGGGGGGPGTGGGSGYLVIDEVSAGSYPLVLGAGGNANQNGSSSTFAGLTAAGGNTGASPNYGIGGTGGGRNTNSIGGYNGGDGQNNPGSGSQLPMVLYALPAPAANITNGGGLYAGGGGGISTNRAGNASPAGTGGGGGAGSGNLGNSGGAGGSGVLIVAEGI